MNRDIELVTTGSELLIGRTVNRHAQVLGEHLQPLGLSLVRDTTVPDKTELIQEAVESALKRVEIVVISGGLGPTSDDLTREAVARVLKRKVVMDAGSLEALRERYKRLGRVVNEPSERQAQVVEGAVALPNSVGAAPGERIDLGAKTIFILPGPPREFLVILEGYVIPWLKERFGAQEKKAAPIFLVCGWGESDIVARFEAAGFPPPALDVAYCANPGRIEVRLTPLDGHMETADRAGQKVRELLGDNIYAEERLTMEEVVGRLLDQQGFTLATAESCTGGLIGHRVTSVSGSSKYYLGGVIVYSNEAKIRDLGVDRASLAQSGAVSEEVARQMAVGVRKNYEADFGLAVTGIAGPTGGTPDKPVGLVFIALADHERTWIRRHRFGGDRSMIKEWSSQTALDLLRRRLQGSLRE